MGGEVVGGLGGGEGATEVVGGKAVVVVGFGQSF